MTYGVKDIAERYGSGLHTVLGWIDRGELAAINVARQAGGRPRWRITEDALQAFERSRSNSPEPNPKRRQRQTADVIDRY